MREVDEKQEISLLWPNTGVIGQPLPPKNDFEHARGLRISAYAVN